MSLAKEVLEKIGLIIDEEPTESDLKLLETLKKRNESMKVPEDDNGMKVGIWWYSPKLKEFVIYSEGLETVSKDSVGFFDVLVSHANWWENTRKYLPTYFKKFEYDELPRGRVILWQKNNGEYVVRLFGFKPLLEKKSFCVELMKEFNIKFPNGPYKVTRVYDHHYSILNWKDV